MKCDKLKDYSILDIEAIDDERYKKEKAPGKFVPESRVYLKTEVDAAIAELKREHHKERHEYIDWVNRLQKENTELKEVYKESVDVKVKIWERFKKAEDEIRKLKRALWLARAERAKECHFMWCQLIYDKKYGIVKFNIRKKWWEEDVKQGQTLHTPQGWADVWDEIEYRCSKKAEEYK